MNSSSKMSKTRATSTSKRKNLRKKLSKRLKDKSTKELNCPSHCKHNLRVKPKSTIQDRGTSIQHFNSHQRWISSNHRPAFHQPRMRNKSAEERWLSTLLSFPKWIQTLIDTQILKHLNRESKKILDFPKIPSQTWPPSLSRRLASRRFQLSNL